MAKRCGCASDTCSCYLNGGDGIAVTGGGTKTNPYVIESDQEGRILDVQDENLTILSGVSILDFQGAGVSALPGGATGEVVVTIPGTTGGGVAVNDEGNSVQVGTQTLNFVGTGIQATAGGPTTVNVTAQAPAAPTPAAAGVVNVTVTSALTGTAAVTFPVGRFSTAPIVVTGLGAASTAWQVSGVGTVTASGFVAYLSRSDPGSTGSGTLPVNWIARAAG